jgi:long-subunit acyl-CoA synthetase (AMP-forming)
LAIIYSGNIAVPIDKELNADDILEQITEADVGVIFYDTNYLKKIQGSLNPARACVLMN